MRQGDYGGNIIGWRYRGNSVPAVLGSLGDDVSSTLLSLGFNSLQIQQIIAAHASGALSDAGYNQIVSGNVSPDALADYMAADPGATETSAAHIAVSNVNAPLMPRPSPSVAVPTSFGAWFQQATLIGGLPNWAVIGVGLVGLTLLTSIGGRRR